MAPSRLAAAVPMVSATAGRAAGATEPMAQASPTLKRSRQREQTMPAAATQVVTLLQLLAEVAGNHACFARDEVFWHGRA